jgi:Immunoglobulin I-set domain./Beta-propeller repeat.
MQSGREFRGKQGSRTITFVLLALFCRGLALSAETVVQSWAQRCDYPGSAVDQGYATACDAAGNVFITGSSDFGVSGADIVTVKYSSTGTPLWTNRFDGAAHGDDYAYAISVDTSGNVLVSGMTETGGVVFGYTAVNAVTLKYSSVGIALWTNFYQGPVYVPPKGVAVDSGENVLVTMASMNDAGNFDYVTLKYSPSGVGLWTNRYSDASPAAVAVDSGGNVFVCGGSGDYVTIKYSSAGTPQWTNHYHGPASGNEEATALVVDPGGNVLVTGDDATIKYSSAGVPLWTNQLSGVAYGVVTDGSGRVFVTTSSSSDTSFSAYAAIAYSSAGAPMWTNIYGQPGFKYNDVKSIAIDSSGNIFITGITSTNAVGSSYLAATVAYSGAGVALWTNLCNGAPGNTASGDSVAVDNAGNVVIGGSFYAGDKRADYLTIKYSGAGAALWTNRYDGQAAKVSVPMAVAVDKDGNILVTGYSFVSVLGGTADYLTVKYTPAGVPVWTNLYNGPDDRDDRANALVVGTNGDVFVTGSTFAPGSTNDYLTIAYSAAGVPLWTNRYGGPGNGDDQALAIALDSNGHVFVTGYSYSGSGPGNDFATVAYSVSGVPLWTNRYNGPGSRDDRANALAVDGSGNVFVTGSSWSTTVSSSADYATIAYSAAGAPLWTNRYNGPGNKADVANAIAVDGAGNVIVTGASQGSGTNDYATIKYSGSGIPLWTNRYNGPANLSDVANAVAVDAAGNIFVTGGSSINVGGFNYATIAYSAAGTPLWTNRYHVPSSSDTAVAMASDADGNVFVTGSSAGAGNFDYVTIKYSGTGVPLWTNRYNGPANGNDVPQNRYALAIAPDGAAIVTGTSDGNYGGSERDGIATVKYISPPSIGTSPTARTNTAGTTSVFAVSAFGSAPLAYQWWFNGAPLTTGSSVSGANSKLLTLPNVQSSQAGSYFVVVTNAFGSVTSPPAIQTVLVPSPMRLIPAFATSNRSFILSFTNTAGATFSVLTSTNVATPLSNWNSVTGLVELSPGQFQFMDRATNGQRFYRLRSP